MALYYELPVYREVYELILMIDACAKDFSKEYKYTLGQDMKKDASLLKKTFTELNNQKIKRKKLNPFDLSMSYILI